MSAPKTLYAKSGDVSIAYQVLGEGPADLVYVWGWISHLDFQWIEPTVSAFLRRLATFCRLIMFDKRGTGLSDPAGAGTTFDERMDDIRAVMDAVGSERATLLGFSEGAAMSALFAASHPERTNALILYDGWAVGPHSDRVPAELRWPERVIQIQTTMERWGEGDTIHWIAPSFAGSTVLKRFWGMFERASMSPATARAHFEALTTFDVRDVLPTIRVPTLVLHHADSAIPAAGGRLMVHLIPGARYVELPGRDHLPGAGDPDAIAGEIEEFLTGARARPRSDRVLATVLFTDMVGSTQRAAELGDSGWRRLLERHDSLVRAELERFGGREVKQTGDGFLATFDGPARAIRCASSIIAAAYELGVQVRTGLHCGECELIGDDIGGVAVHLAARVCELAAPGEVLVSGTVKDLVMGSGVELVDRGTHDLKGVPGEWRLFAVGAERPASSSAPAAFDQPGLADRAVRRVIRSTPGLGRAVVRALRGRSTG